MNSLTCELFYRSCDQRMLHDSTVFSEFEKFRCDLVCVICMFVCEKVVYEMSESSIGKRYLRAD